MMMHRLSRLQVCLVFSAAALVLPGPALAQPDPGPSAADTGETVVVTGNRLRLEQRRDLLGTAHTVLSGEDLKARQTRSLADALRDVPGVTVTRSGSLGGLTQLRLRGAEANHTLVLFDGVDIGDPFQGEADLAGLLTSGIARIEILRGEQSALYGSDAIGGVVNIIPRRGEGPLSGMARLEGGSFDTLGVTLDAGLGDEVVDLFASLAHTSTSGVNLARNGSERDGTRVTSGFVNAGVRPADWLELRALLRYVGNTGETDPQDFAFPATPTQGLVIDGDNRDDTEQRFGALSAEVTLLDGDWITRLTLSGTDVERRSFAGGLPSFFTDGSREEASLVSGYRLEAFGGEHTLTGAVDWTQEAYRNVPIGAPGPQNAERRTEAVGIVLAYDAVFGDLGVGLAVRHDANDRFDDADTIRAQASYGFTGTGTRLRASGGTGVKNPTNFELFGFNPTSFIGNPDLKPETSVGWDIGLDQVFAEGMAVARLTWFEAELEDEIFTAFLPGFVSTPRNRTTRSERRGVEAELDAQLGETWRLVLAATWLDTEEAGRPELRRPEWSGSLNLTYSAFEGRGRAGLTLRYAGERQDSEFIFATPADRVTLGPDTTLALFADYALDDRLTLFARVEDVFDTRAEEVFSYQAPGRAAYVGLSTAF